MQLQIPYALHACRRPTVISNALRPSVCVCVFFFTLSVRSLWLDLLHLRRHDDARAFAQGSRFPPDAARSHARSLPFRCTPALT